MSDGFSDCFERHASTRRIRSDGPVETAPMPADASRRAVVDQLRHIVNCAGKNHLNHPGDAEYDRLGQLMAEWELDILRRAGVVVKR